VSSAVNRTANDFAALLEPVAATEVAEAKPATKAKPKAKKDDGQASLF
jgi:hypothetical protein